MSGSIDNKEAGWVYSVGDLVRFSPSRRYWDYYDGYGYPYLDSENMKVGAIGVIVEKYEKYGYHSMHYYKIRWLDKFLFSNEKHEDLVIVSSTQGPKKE